MCSANRNLKKTLDGRTTPYKITLPDLFNATVQSVKDKQPFLYSYDPGRQYHTWANFGVLQ